MIAPEYYIFTGGDGEVIPRHVTHVRMDESLKFVPAWAFFGHPNIEVVECHDGVERIKGFAFGSCPSLRRVIMPGVKDVEFAAFAECKALTYIECGKLERIGNSAFRRCESLSSVDLPSIMFIEGWAFERCKNLTDAKLGGDLESVGPAAFIFCSSLERITLPLKDGIIEDDRLWNHGWNIIADNTVFKACENLNRVDLVGEVHETIAALLLEDWKNDMNDEIDTISRILPNTPAGNQSLSRNRNRRHEDGGKAQAIRTWIRSVLQKLNHYKAEHRRVLTEAADALQSSLPDDIVSRSIMPFLELPSYTFERENWIVYPLFIVLGDRPADTSVIFSS